MNDIQTAIGREIRNKLSEKGRNQKWLSEQCGVSESCISMIIHGKMKPSIETAVRISKLIDADFYCFAG